MNPFLPQETRFLGLEDPHADYAQANAVIIPAPFEQSSTYKKGSFLGPQAILEASQQVELFDAALAREPWKDAHGIATRAPLHFPAYAPPQEVLAQLTATVKNDLAQGKKAITLTGEHTGALGPIRAHLNHFTDFTILQLDAHADLRDTYLDSPYNHACVARRILEDTPNLIQVGIRSLCQEEYTFINDTHCPTFYAENLLEQDRRGQDWLTPILEQTKKNIYITFDCDVLDPALMPATGTPEPAGLSFTQITRLLQRLSEHRTIIGADCSELAPIPHLHHPQFTIAKLLYRLIAFMFNQNTAP